MALDPLPQDLASHKVVQLKVRLLSLSLSSNPHQSNSPPLSTQELLKERSLPVSGTKAQLISRLQENDTNQDRERENGEQLQEDTETNDKGDKRRPLQDEQEDGERENKRARVGEEVDQELENPNEEDKVAVPSFDSAPALKTIEEQKGRPVNESIVAEEGEGAIQGGETKDTENSSNGHEAVISTNQEVVAEEGTTERQEAGEKMVERQDEVAQKKEEKEEEEEVPDYSFTEEDDSSSRPTDMYLDTVCIYLFPSPCSS